MKNRFLLLMAILSGVLLSLPFLNLVSSLLMFIALVPLFFAIDHILNHKTRRWLNFWLYVYISLLTWNVLTTWWIINATAFFGVLAMISNAVLMCSVFFVIYKISDITGKKSLPYVFIIIWLGFEYFYFDAEISWPWLTLGNAFSNDIMLIQWYEYTGVLGGSLWILVCNFIIFYALKNFLTGANLKGYKRALMAFVLIIVPVGISLHIFYHYHEKEQPYRFTVVQPNIDPYNEKFSGMPVSEQMDKMINLALQASDSTTQFIIFPETALPEGIWEEQLLYSDEYLRLQQVFKKFPHCEIITGASTARVIPPNEKIPSSARRFSDANRYYERFNTALFVTPRSPLQIYHKSKLVIGVEKMPYPAIFKFIEKYAINLGGITGSLGIQKEQIPFESAQYHVRLGTAICYESVYGEFVTRYIKNGAQFFVIITNDGWWGNTPGHRQHKSYASLRAIETRRSIARSANTGISCFINQRGEIIQPTTYWREAVITGQLNANNDITFYVRYGDYLGRIAAFFAVLLMVYAFVQYLLQKNRNKKAKGIPSGSGYRK